MKNMSWTSIWSNLDPKNSVNTLRNRSSLTLIYFTIFLYSWSSSREMASVFNQPVYVFNLPLILINKSNNSTRLAASEKGISREEFIEAVANDVLKKIPEEYEVWKVRRYFQRMMSPTIVVLLQELERFNKLISTMRRSLVQLKKALAGEIGMDAVLDNVAYSLFNGQLPANWRKLAPATCKNLGGWMEHFEARQQQYFSWVRNTSYNFRYFTK